MEDRKYYPYFAVLSMTVVMIFISFSAFASPEEKFFRSVENMVVFPAEIPKHAVREAARAPKDILVPFYGGFYGMPKGAAFGISRAISGVIDFLTFPFNAPSEWKQVIPMEKFTFEESISPNNS